MDGDDIVQKEKAEDQDEFRAEATISATLKNVAQIKRDQLSPPVYVRTLPWRILLKPNDSNLGFFLQCNGENNSSSWSCYAKAELRLKCHKLDAPAARKRPIKHIFCAKANDFGYMNFISMSELLNPDNHFMDNGSITLEVDLVAEAPHGVPWDSKKHTGYVGLRNQGATCYINSLLQMLYFTNSLRLCVYRVPTEADDINKSMCLTLQRVFHGMQFSDRPVGTKRLTKSFGWQTIDMLMQQDVQEFLRVFLEKLESKMRGTCLEGTIPALFEGEMSSYIKCKNIDFNSTRYETFYDIQLNIKDMKNIYESFQYYVASEALEGDNKYDAGVHGLQEASKGVIFTALPPVLHLHLMRFQYDAKRDISTKYNDRFEFYEQINLDPYLAKQAMTPADYVLHAVLVHSGDIHGGHYVVFINPKADGRWYKFDDEIVTTCRKEEAIEHNYGGINDEIKFHSKSTNAYMLVYMRQSHLDRILIDIPQCEISSDLLERFDLERRIDMVCRKQHIEAHLHLTINIILEEHFEAHQKFRLFDTESMTAFKSFKLQRNLTVDNIVELLSSAFGVPRHRMRLWGMCSIAAKDQKFMYIDVEAYAMRTLNEIPNDVQKPWCIFLELAQADCPGRLPPFNPQLDVLLFLKFYDARRQHLNYIGCTQQPLNRRLCELVPEINRKLGFASNTKLTVFDEYAGWKIHDLEEPIGNLLNMAPKQLQGTILIFERENVDAKLDLPTVADYLMDVVSRIEISFSDKANPYEPDFTLELSPRCNYDQLAQTVAVHLNTDPTKLQFFKCISYDWKMPGVDVPYTYTGTINDLWTQPKESSKKHLFYQKLSLSIHELDNKNVFKCIYVSNNLKEEKKLVLYPNRNDTVRELLDKAAKVLTFTDSSQKKLRLLRVSNHKIVAICKNYEPIDGLRVDLSTARISIYRIEEIPNEEAQLDENELLIPVAHYTNDLRNAFGVPFLIKVRHKEPHGAVKQRIQRRLNVPDTEWEHYKFVVCITLHLTIDVSDNSLFDLVAFRNWSGIEMGQLPFFGLDHINKTRKRESSEKAIKIYN
ncbi:ubiquitin carboxyl-terminal hydrolase 7 [Drosophila grimshawi]|uniref:Ubiquitin carboxyl-terminal hydrolase 7 n=1 Tax=Drosophila grimshawi TaxID=7222 RepID=B4J1Z1_DROGR|nr:ubiquitin carboxyl-terminal hydrolase 7 [Drosophila grimshawi]EDV95916.1 GH15967 [Drosophila grimshawi]